MMLGIVAGQKQIGFVTRWTVAGDATARTITLPLVNTRTEGALAYNFTVNWGDGSALSTVTTYNSANAVHTYASNGTYNVEIKGTCEGWSFNNAGDKLKIVAVVNWGTVGGHNGWKYLRGGFYGCTNLTSLGVGSILASGTGILTDGFSQTFNGCTSLTSIPVDLFRYNTAVSTYGFSQTFYGCTSLTSIPVDLFRYNTAVSTSGFSQTFYGCTKLQVLSNTFYEPGEEATLFLNRVSDFTSAFSRTSFSGTQGVAPNLWTCDFGETITLSLAPASDWVGGDTITGQTSGATAVVVAKVSALVYKIKQHFGTFSLGEIVGVTGTPTKLALQGGANPTFAGTPVSTSCFAGAGNSIASLSNYASIPASWK